MLQGYEGIDEDFVAGEQLVWNYTIDQYGFISVLLEDSSSKYRAEMPSQCFGIFCVYAIGNLHFFR